MATNENAVKHCPFCGAEGPANIVTHRYKDHWNTDCLPCGAAGPDSSTHDGAILLWNTRVGDNKDPIATIINKPTSIIVTSYRYHQEFPVINMPRLYALNMALKWALERADKIEMLSEAGYESLVS